MRTICCDEPVVEAIVRHARREAPRECCGVLVGLGDTIVEAVPLENVAEGVNRFQLDPAGHIAARRDARERGLTVLGVYHSHPRSPAQPSARDLADATYDEYLYGIASLVDAAPSAFRIFALVGGRFEEVALARSRCHGRPAAP